jgi:hypothetical protein
LYPFKPSVAKITICRAVQKQTVRITKHLCIHVSEDRKLPVNKNEDTVRYGAVLIRIVTN